MASCSALLSAAAAAAAGRWKAVTVAVKIIEHHDTSQGAAASSIEKQASAGREAFLATSILHPNVVSQCCQVSLDGLVDCSSDVMTS
jgi:hypothetical protein